MRILQASDNVQNITSRKPKRKFKEKQEFTVLTNQKETEEFIEKCRAGHIHPKKRPFDKEKYIKAHPQSATLGCQCLNMDQNNMVKKEIGTV